MDKRESSKKVQQSPSKVKLDFVQRPIKLSKKEKNLTDLIICEFMCKSMTLAAQKSVSLPHSYSEKEIHLYNRLIGN
jgi:hypothetical protein